MGWGRSAGALKLRPLSEAKFRPQQPDLASMSKKQPEHVITSYAKTLCDVVCILSSSWQGELQSRCPPVLL